MFLSAVFPICDLRGLQPGEGAGLRPTEFVPWFGPVRSAGNQARTRGAPGDSRLVAAGNALKLLSWPLGEKPGPFRCLFRDLVADGEVVRRFDLAVGTRTDERHALPVIETLVRGFAGSQVAVPERSRTRRLDLVHAGIALARAYAEATTRAPDRPQLGPDLVVAADPAFFVVWSEGEGLSERGLPPLSPVPGSPSLLAGRAPLTEAGPTSCVWYVKQLGDRVSLASELRADLADLWAHRACLRAALQRVADGRLSPPPNPPEQRRPGVAPAPTASNRLQGWLDAAVALVDRRQRKVPVSTAPLRFAGAESEARDLSPSIAGGAGVPEIGALAAALAKLEVRRNLARKVTDWALRDATTGEAVRLFAKPPPENKHGPQPPFWSFSAPITRGGNEGVGPDEPDPNDVLVHLPTEVPQRDLQGTLHTTLSARGRELVEPGDRVAFDVHLSLDEALPHPGPAGATGAFPVTIPAGVNERRLHLSASSRDFAPLARENWSKTVLLRRDGPSPGLWSFEGVALGDRASYTFSVSFVLDDEPAGTLTVTLGRRGAALAASVSTRSDASLSFGETSQTPVSVMIDIVYEGNVPVVKWKFPSGDGGRPWEIRFDTTDHWNALGAPQYQPYPELRGFSRRLGAEMDQDLFEQLRKARGGAVLVVSPLPLFPFELVPLGRKEPFLGTECSVARWTSLPDVRPPTARDLLVKKAVCIRPDYTDRPLPSAAEEETKLGARLPGLLHVGKRAELETLLDGDSPYEDVTLVHFAGHAEDNPPKLRLAGESPLLPSDFWQSPLAERHPFLFVNGCRAGMAHSGLPPSLGNMIEVLLKSKLAGVVAPFITVDSRAASRAADAFYAAALGGKTIAEAVREIRRLAEVDPAHAATYLSYLSYVTPGLRLVRQEPQS
jgi:hypothetical protein